MLCLSFFKWQKGDFMAQFLQTVCSLVSVIWLCCSFVHRWCACWRALTPTSWPATPAGTLRSTWLHATDTTAPSRRCWRPAWTSTVWWGKHQSAARVPYRHPRIKVIPGRDPRGPMDRKWQITAQKKIAFSFYALCSGKTTFPLTREDLKTCL